jgi:hypothetical protein
MLESLAICWGAAINRLLNVIATTGVMFAGAQALAVDSINQPTIGKRQMIVQVADCMRKQMSSSKTVSYNQSMKACRDQINKRMDNSMSGALVASAAPAKP